MVTIIALQKHSLKKNGRQNYVKKLPVMRRRNGLFGLLVTGRQRNRYTKRQKHASTNIHINNTENTDAPAETRATILTDGRSRHGPSRHHSRITSLCRRYAGEKTEQRHRGGRRNTTRPICSSSVGPNSIAASHPLLSLHSPLPRNPCHAY